MSDSRDDFAKWVQVRNRGMLRFVLVQGCLAWGLGTAVLCSLLMWTFTDVDITRFAPVALVAFPAGGLLWGAAMWWIVEYLYARHMRRAGSN